MSPDRESIRSVEPVEVFDEHGRPLGRSAQATASAGASPRSRAWVQSSARAGVGMGTALAIAISWSVHQSIVWAIIHGFLSWIYVVYYALTR